jgi:hypothetical protein
MPEHDTWFPTSKYGTSVLNVKNFGALGDGSHNDGPNIQAALNAIQESQSHRALYFPHGLYYTSQVLYITNTSGVNIFGDGMYNGSTIAYNGPNNAGNTEAALGAGQEVTPVLMLNGCKYSSFENLNISPIPGPNTAGIYIYFNNTKGPTHSNYWKNILVDGGILQNSCQTCWLVGYGVLGLCSEQTYINCGANNANLFGWRIVAANALNNNLFNCGGTFNNVWASCPTGSMNIIGASLAANTIDIEPGQTPMAIIGCRTESSQFVNMYDSQGFASIIACTQSPGTTTPGPMYFVKLANGSTAVLENCYIGKGLATSHGVVSTQDGRIWIRGGYAEPAGAPFEFLNGCDGQIREFSTQYAIDTVAELPSAHARWKGHRFYVNDANATTFNSVVAPGGSNTVPVFCDGAATPQWRIG